MNNSSKNNDKVISTVDVHKSYKLGKNNFVYALRGASLEINSNEMTAIMGPSGSGKSTIMHIMGCLDRPDKGQVFLNGSRVDNLRRRALNTIRSHEIGFIFQGFNLVTTFTAIENVSLAAEYAGASRREAKRKAIEALKLVGLGERLSHKPNELSGGQQQRVAIARSLINNPKVVLGDEPTGDLDTATSVDIINIMRNICNETGTTFVLVTHDPEVAQACNRIINMRDGIVTNG